MTTHNFNSGLTIGGGTNGEGNAQIIAKYNAGTLPMSKLAGHRRPTVPLEVELISPSDHTYDTLIAMCAERVCEVEEHSISRLKEYFDTIKDARPQDWFSWCHKAIRITATKTQTSQRNIGYLIGIYKAWLRIGFGRFAGTEAEDLIARFASKFGVEPSERCRRELIWLMQDYGIMNTTESILLSNAPEPEDPSMMALNACKKYIEEKGWQKANPDPRYSDGQ